MKLPRFQITTFRDQCREVVIVWGDQTTLISVLAIQILKLRIFELHMLYAMCTSDPSYDVIVFAIIMMCTRAKNVVKPTVTVPLYILCILDLVIYHWGLRHCATDILLVTL